VRTVTLDDFITRNPTWGINGLSIMQMIINIISIELNQSVKRSRLVQRKVTITAE
ncbi:putative membrane protein, partial [Trichinella spiralis]|uniref:hypothetical protein n=1 Tax=Trichinella spiralis TaxID=6334 RepID=UPI0001EFCA47